MELKEISLSLERMQKGTQAGFRATTHVHIYNCIAIDKKNCFRAISWNSKDLCDQSYGYLQPNMIAVRSCLSLIKIMTESFQEISPTIKNAYFTLCS